MSVTGTATQVAGENPGRITLLVANAGNAAVFLGNASVTAATGYPLAPGASVELATTAAVHAVAASGSASVRFLDLANAI